MVPKISVIIPVYNSQDVLERCLDSLRNQTFKNFEAIFVNDGSTDNSLKVLNSFSDSFIRIVDKSNGGPSSARNEGLKYAQGDYITFLDSDDEYCFDFLELMLNEIEKDSSDICFCNYIDIYNGSEEEIKIIYNDKCNKKDFIISNMIGRENDKDVIIWGTVWRTILKKELINKYNLKFDEELLFSEDFLFLLEFLMNCNKVSILDKCIYKYYRNNSSLLNRYKSDYLNQNLNFHAKFVSLLVKFNLYDVNKTRYLRNKFRMYTVCFSNSCRDCSFNRSYKECKNILNRFLCDKELFTVFKHLSFIEKIIYLIMKLRLTIVLLILFKFKEKWRLRKFN